MLPENLQLLALLEDQPRRTRQHRFDAYLQEVVRLALLFSVFLTGGEPYELVVDWKILGGLIYHRELDNPDEIVEMFKLFFGSSYVWVSGPQLFASFQNLTWLPRYHYTEFVANIIIALDGGYARFGYFDYKLQYRPTAFPENFKFNYRAQILLFSDHILDYFMEAYERFFIDGPFRLTTSPDILDEIQFYAELRLDIYYREIPKNTFSFFLS